MAHPATPRRPVACRTGCLDRSAPRHVFHDPGAATLAGSGAAAGGPPASNFGSPDRPDGARGVAPGRPPSVTDSACGYPRLCSRPFARLPPSRMTADHERSQIPARPPPSEHRRVRPPIDGSAGPREPRERHPLVRPGRSCQGSRVAGRGRPGHRRRPGPVRRPIRPGGRIQSPTGRDRSRAGRDAWRCTPTGNRLAC